MCDELVIYKLWKSREIILEVLASRGYTIPQEDHLSFAEFEKWAGSDTEEDIRKSMDLEFPSDHENPRVVNIKIYWPVASKLGTNIREICKDMEEHDITRAIIIIDVSVTPATKGILRNLRKEGIYIDVYNINEAQFNMMKHVLVPKHEICSDDQKKKVLTTYSLTKDMVPRILISDPAVRHLGALHDDLIKITRRSHTLKGCESISYCIVVDAGPQKKKGKRKF